MKYQLLFTLQIVFLTLFAGAQSIQPERISITDGLSSAVANGIFQDSYGLIWVPTQAGLNVYDGYKIRTFRNNPNDPGSLIDNLVWHVDEDKDKNIWIATDRGISKYIRAENRFVNYPPEVLLENFSVDIAVTPGANFRIFYIFVDSRNTVWATSFDAPVLRFNRESGSWDIPQLVVADSTHMVSSLPTMAYPIAEDNNGGIWLGSINHGLMTWDAQSNVFRQAVIKEKPEGFVSFDRNKLLTRLFFDRENTLWMTGRNGIYKYDPTTYELEVVEEYDREEPGIFSTYAGITSDKEGNVWVANHDQSLLRFDGLSERYESLHVDGEVNPYTGKSMLVFTGIMTDDAGLVWLSTSSAGILKYNPYTEPFTIHTHDPNDPGSISISLPFGLQESLREPGKIYVGTRGGMLNIYDPEKQVFEKISYPVSNDMFGGSVRSILEESDGTLWLGTWGDGLLKMDRNYRVLAQYVNDPMDNTSLSGNQIRLIKKDSKGNLWLGGEYLDVFNPNTGKAIRISDGTTSSYPRELIAMMRKKIENNEAVSGIGEPGDFENLSETVTIDSEGTFLVVSAGEGITEFGEILFDYGWMEDQKGDTLWTSQVFGTSFYLGGNFKNRIKAGIIHLPAGEYRLRYISDDSHSYGAWNEAPPPDSLLWGIHLLRIDSPGEAETYQALLKETMNTRFVNGRTIRDIHFSADGIAWIATQNSGLNKYNLVTQEYKNFSHDPLNSQTISHNGIQGLYEDSDNILWVATDGGLNRFDPVSEVFTVYTEDDGLPTNFISAVLPGDGGTLWMSTMAGITQMIPGKSNGKPTFVNYDLTDGLGGTSFIPLVALKSSQGRYFFGGEHGLVEFGAVAANPSPPKLLLTDLKISNKSVLLMGEASPLKTSIYDLREIRLTHSQNDLGFEFAALHYANPSKNQYAHMLEGYDKEWVYDNNKMASYTNLDPGTYVFRVRGSNRDGIWNEEGLAIQISILPPWWQTTAAYIVYFLLFCGLIFGFDRFQRQRLIARERERSREVELQHAREIEKAYKDLEVAHETLKAAQEQLVQQEKLASLGQLTAGIAHEIKNPLNFVNNFADVSIELVDEVREEIHNVEKIHEFSLQSISQNLDDVKSNLHKILEHGMRADNIVKSMLMHSRGSSGQKEPTDINALADEYLRLAYHGMRASDKSFNAAFHAEFDPDLPKIEVVPQDFGRVILNLVNNAFQAVHEKSLSIVGSHHVGANNYSPLQGGTPQPQMDYQPTVTITTKKLGNHIEIAIKDNGNGIPEHIKAKIFQPFFTTKPTGQGTGLGLSLSYDIVKAHGGELKVETKEGHGSTFIITISSGYEPIE